MYEKTRTTTKQKSISKTAYSLISMELNDFLSLSQYERHWWRKCLLRCCSFTNRRTIESIVCHENNSVLFGVPQVPHQTSRLNISLVVSEIYIHLLFVRSVIFLFSSLFYLRLLMASTKKHTQLCQFIMFVTD